MNALRIQEKTKKFSHAGSVTSLAGFSLLALGLIGVVSTTPRVFAATENGEGHHALLSGDRILQGTVQEIKSGQARVDMEKGEPRFVPMNVRKDKGLPALKKGDRVEITVNDQNLIVDIHLEGEASHHRIVHGKLTQPLITGHDKAVILTEEGNEEAHLVRPLARSKVASVPVGAKAVFLIDERNGIADVTYNSLEAVAKAQQLWQQKTPLKASFSRVSGVIVKRLKNHTISIRTEDGKEYDYEVRPLMQIKLHSLTEGKSVVLFVDDENKVTDVSVN